MDGHLCFLQQSGVCCCMGSSPCARGMCGLLAKCSGAGRVAGTTASQAKACPSVQVVSTCHPHPWLLLLLCCPACQWRRAGRTLHMRTRPALPLTPLVAPGPPSPLLACSGGAWAGRAGPSSGGELRCAEPPRGLCAQGWPHWARRWAGAGLAGRACVHTQMWGWGRGWSVGVPG